MSEYKGFMFPSCYITSYTVDNISQMIDMSCVNIIPKLAVIDYKTGLMNCDTHLFKYKISNK